ncbi:sec-independent protein translocase protein TatB-like [Tripterygium wilfordii]|uniref:sec-independent protein translocase protein TatB-like n=1 Tax=Tripterygium wilfordii TaxID=458696 RepID=UPI0018F8550C|nr:sec-independent protein translocase protein TatB-like [Tripterygium wilfordii]XP_038713085.1 sec-independent protein translocase protein TatB-like [Tripterygium wilfordii]XP_038713086.1 sec-independent protein translocase protein TatB-like [Tripterygium wilfordii]XP_038713088.1 sec-independent protein translocase protein TatB-like [Tripterygium wilfordii]
MFGISYGELFLLLGATAALIGPKDLPIIARTAGKFAGRAIGYVQLARGQFDSVMQQSQARQVHKELQDTMAQLDAIRHEIRSVSFMNPGPMTRRLVDNLDNTSPGSMASEEPPREDKSLPTVSKDCRPTAPDSCNMHSQATAFARLAESPSLKDGSTNISTKLEKLNTESGLLTILPVSAESTGLLPKRQDEIKGSDIVLEAIVEAEVAHNAKEFFSQPQNQIKYE